MLATIFLFRILPLISGSSITTRSLKRLDQTALTGFLVPFRESVLHMVAVEWNNTLQDSAALHLDLQACSGKIKSSVDTCKLCTVKICESEGQSVNQVNQEVSHSPTFTDYMKLALTLVNPVNYLKEPLNEIGSRLGDLVDLLGDGSDSFISSMASLGKSVGGAFTGAFHGLEHGVNKLGGSFTQFGNGVVDIGNTAIGGITDVGNTAIHGIKDAANTVAHVGSSVIHSIGSIFGRKRTTIDPRLLHCMEQCTTCDALLITNQRQMITSVCGPAVVTFNDTVRANVVKIKGIFATVSSKIAPIISNIEVNPASLEGLVYNDVYVTASIKGRYVRYHSDVSYDMMNSATSAQKIASEYWQKWLK